MRSRINNSALIWAMCLTWLLPAAAQVTVGDNTNVSLQGSLSMGYSGSYGTPSISSHGIDVGGAGQLHGYYYNPRFFSFDFQPYYRRSQSNSIYQSITDGSGFTGTTNFFTGSNFPGSVFFSKAYDSTGQFGIPGANGSIITRGKSQGYGITWSALLPDLPTLTASYSNTAGSSSVYGSDVDSRSRTHNFTLQSTYTLAGFQLQGQYTRLAMDADFPVFLQSGETQESQTASNTFTVSAGHQLPLNGYWSVGLNRSTYAGAYRSSGADGSTNGTVNDVNSQVALNPTRKLSLGFGTDYNDNLYGSLQQQIFQAGGAETLPYVSSSRTFSLSGQAGYVVFSHLSLYGRATHYEQWLPGRSRGLTQFGGNAAFNFAHRLLGALTFSVGVVDTATEDGNSGASLVGNVNFLRRLYGWEVGATFGYTQQVQTLVDIYTTSMYRYGVTANRRFGRLHWANSFNGGHSGLTQFEGFRNRSEGFASSLQYGRYGLNGQYSQSYGTSVLTPGGLVEVPGVPPVLEPILYNAHSYGGGASFTPFRRCVLSANYAKATSDTMSTVLASSFNSTIFNTRLQYQFRKLNLDANFTRFQQSISTGSLPADFNTYWIRVSRWFNVF